MLTVFLYGLFGVKLNEPPLQTAINRVGNFSNLFFSSPPVQYRQDGLNGDGIIRGATAELVDMIRKLAGGYHPFNIIFREACPGLADECR